MASIRKIRLCCHRPVIVLAVAVLSIHVLVTSGCSDSGTGEPETRRNPSGGEATQQEIATGNEPGGAATDAAKPLGDDELPSHQAKNPLIRGLGRLLGSSPVIEDDDELQQGLLQADSILSEIKEENRQALRDLNRQIPINSQRSPNIIVLVADNLGYGDLSVYGQQEFQTPNMDGLAAQGLRLTQFYGGGASSAASQWCLLTGCDTSRARRGNRLSFTLAPDSVTLGEVMWQAGYETVFVGAWSVGSGVASDMPHLHGFDRWLGTLATDEPSAFPTSLWSDGTEIRLRANSGGKEGVFVQDFYVEEIVGYLENHSRKRPFLLLADLPGPELTRGSVSDEYEGTDWTDEEKAHAAALTDLDRDVGRIMQALKQYALGNSTVVFLTSDNGPSALAADTRDRISRTGGLRGHAGDLYEGGLRVPLIVCWPGRIAPNTVDDTPAAIWDLLATCADLGGVSRRPRPQDGISLKPLLHGGEISRSGMMYWETQDPGFAQAVRQGDWKVVRPSGKMELADVELYQLAEDPAESRNLASENPEIVAQFIKGQ